MIGQAKVRFCIVLVLIASIFAVVGCSQSPSDEGRDFLKSADRAESQESRQAQRRES